VSDLSVVLVSVLPYCLVHSITFVNWSHRDWDEIEWYVQSSIGVTSCIFFHWRSFGGGGIALQIYYFNTRSINDSNKKLWWTDAERVLTLLCIPSLPVRFQGTDNRQVRTMRATCVRMPRLYSMPCRYRTLGHASPCRFDVPGRGRAALLWRGGGGVQIFYSLKSTQTLGKDQDLIIPKVCWDPGKTNRGFHYPQGL
jgi:hypothetical protein